jgi:hypothetical protein
MAWAKICETIRPCDRAAWETCWCTTAPLFRSSAFPCGPFKNQDFGSQPWLPPSPSSRSAHVLTANHLSIIISEQGLSRSSTEGR